MADSRVILAVDCGGLIAYILYPFVLLLQRQFRLNRKISLEHCIFLQPGIDDRTSH